MGVEFGSGAGATLVLTQFGRFLKAFNDRKALKGYDTINQQYVILQHLMHEIGADRVLLIHTSNGGGIPNGACPIYVTIDRELYSSNSDVPIMADFQRILCDFGYIKLVNRLIQDKFVFITSPNEVEGFLRTQYLFEEVRSAALHQVCQHENNLYYISVRWNKDSVSNLPEASIKDKMNLESQKLARLITG